MKLAFISLFIFVSFTSVAQKKVLDHDAVALWKRIDNQEIAPNGTYVVYDLQQDNSDSHLILKSNKGETLLEYHRASKGLFTYDSKFLTFTIKPLRDSIDNMKRKKVKKEKTS